MLFAYILLISGVLIKTSEEKINTNSRSKRFLIQTRDTQFGAFATVSIPLHPDSTVSMAWFFEANYYTTANSTFLHPIIGIVDEPGRSAREVKQKDLITRTSIYKILESMFEKHGFGGRGCLLRAICENTHSHFLHNGVLGDLLHLLLTPSASEPEESIEDDYYVAEYLGFENECSHYLELCPESPLNYISLFS